MPKSAKRATVRSQIERVVKRIVKRFDPEKIILFGSRARGDARADSDADLLVVMPFSGRKLDKCVEVQGALPRTGISFDIILTTPEDFAWRKDVVGTIEWPATREGRVLYAKR